MNQMNQTIQPHDVYNFETEYYSKSFLDKCASKRYNDSRWASRPQFARSQQAPDLEWLTKPLQPPYLATDTDLMSYDLNMYKNPDGSLKPEVTPDPCSYPTATQYESSNKTTYTYDRSYPSLTIPQQPCKYFARSTLPDIACIDQQNLMIRDTYASALRKINRQ